MLEDGSTARGSVTTVQRVGSTIRRPVGPWTPMVHALLRHLERAGFDAAPRVLGVDDEGREILSFLVGEVALRPWPSVLRRLDGIVALARWLVAYHQAVRNFAPPPAAEWRVPGTIWQPGQIIRHGDLGAWNTIWDGDRLVGVIDWDFAEPGTPLEDIAQLAWYLVPLRGEAQRHQAGLDGLGAVSSRFRALCDACGVGRAEVLVALSQLQAKERARTIELGGRGLDPWASFLARGDAEEMAAEADWLAAHHSWLASC